MKTTQASKETLLVWTIIVSLFAILTVISVNFDGIIDSSFLNKKEQNVESFHSGSRDELLNQPGYSVVLAQ